MIPGTPYVKMGAGLHNNACETFQSGGICNMFAPLDIVQNGVG